MVFVVQFVCAANVCRSPVAAALASRRFATAALGSGVSVQSAGVEASAGSAVCARACSWVDKHRSIESLPAHRVRGLSDTLIDTASLILAADESVSEIILQRRPDAQQRTFTIIEAMILAESVVGRSVDGRGDPVTAPKAGLDVTSVTARLHDVTAEMHASRGRVPLTWDGGPRPLGRHRRTRSCDIPDAHTPDGASHRRMLPLLSDVVERWTATYVLAGKA